ncbi:MAG: CAP domain-containing protein [Polyangiaceae bacterium]
MTRASLVVALLLAACGGGLAHEGGELADLSGPQPSDDWRKAPKSASGWTSATFGPEKTAAPLACGNGDEALVRAAKALAKTRTPESGLPGATELKLTVQREGSPFVWPRAFIAWGNDAQALATSAQSARAQDGEVCGEALEKRADGTYALAIVFAVARAALAPLPRQVRVGEWVNVDVATANNARSAKVYIAHDREAPYAVPTTFDRGHVIARFAAKAPGVHHVQVVVDMGDGPKPLIEAAVFAGIGPSDERYLAGDRIVVSNEASPEARLLSYLTQARGGKALERRAELDAVALAHTERMRAAHKLAHTVDDGTASDRVAAAHIRAKVIGENVALAKTVEEAHQALMASPSHRGNILNAAFRAVGLSVLPDADGNVWVTEVFVTP